MMTALPDFSAVRTVGYGRAFIEGSSPLLARRALELRFAIERIKHINLDMKASRFRILQHCNSP
jgi:hypothetical protein